MQHIAFIMDGNRTWARAHSLPSFEGHRRGYENAKKIIRAVSKRNIAFVSLWALSDDNIRNRSEEEISALFDLLATGIGSLAKEAKKDGNRIVIIGDRSLIPRECQRAIEKAEILTETEKGTMVIIAIGYGGQEEILRAVRAYITDRDPSSPVTIEDFSRYIESSAYPPPDIIVRTGGHVRHSGFFLFASPYAEYFFSEKNWPDFDEAELDLVLADFVSRTRKYGK